MDLRQTFRALHETPFILPNPWDFGSAGILASMGFPALATTSAGFANALGRADGAVTRVSTGSAISMAAQSAIVDAARELLGSGTQKFWMNALANASVVNEAFSKDS